MLTYFQSIFLGHIYITSFFGLKKGGVSMENSDVVKEEVRVRLEKFEEVVGAIPKHQKTLSEIKVF